MTMANKTNYNPFFTESEISDNDFLASGNRGRGRTTGMTGTAGFAETADAGGYDRLHDLQQQKQHSMNRQLESTHRCIASIYDSERTGIATAEELMKQGEQLDNVERKTDKINADTKVSQRHLNGIKSIFGGLKNWWSGEGKKDETAAAALPVKEKPPTKLQQTLNENRDSRPHPALRLRSDDASGFYDDDATDGRSRLGAAQTQRSSEWQQYEENLSRNLDLMSSGMSQLKSLAVGLGDEIESQNEQLERIMPKVDRADTKIRDQNRQMKQILGK